MVIANPGIRSMVVGSSEHRVGIHGQYEPIDGHRGRFALTGWFLDNAAFVRLQQVALEGLLTDLRVTQAMSTCLLRFGGRGWQLWRTAVRDLRNYCKPEHRSFPTSVPESSRRWARGSLVSRRLNEIILKPGLTFILEPVPSRPLSTAHDKKPVAFL